MSIEAIVDRVLAKARANESVTSCDMSDLHTIELPTIEVLDKLKDKLHPVLAGYLDSPSSRENIEIDISIGLEFAFWFNNRGQLVYER